MSFTKSNEPNWMDRLPRIQSRSKSQAMSDSEVDEKGPLPPGQLPGVVGRKPFLRRLREEDNPSRQGSRSSSRHRSSKTTTWESGRGPGGPISQSAIKPQRRATSPDPISRSDSETLAVKSESPPSSEDKRQDDGEDVGEIYEEGENTVFEDKEGNVLAVEPTSRREDGPTREREERREGRRLMREVGADKHEGVAEDEYTEDQGGEELMDKVRSWGEEARDEVEGSPVAYPERPGTNWRNGLRKMSTVGASYFRPKGELTSEQEKPKPEPPVEKKHGPARAYQFGNTIIIEDEDGEVIKKYDIPAPEGAEKANQGVTQKGLEQMGKMFGFGNKKAAVQAGVQPAAEASAASPPAQPVDRQQDTEEENDNNLRFTMGGRRYSTAEFIQEIGNMAPKRRVQAVENSNAPEEIKREARKEARQQAGMQRRATGDVPVVVEQPEYEDRMATVEKTNSHDDHSLKLVTSKDEHIPFHDVAADLKSYSLQSPKGESAADRRRREALQGTTEEDSDDDGTDRIPPAMRAGPSGSNQEASDTVETAAERRRRLAALGQQKDQDSDSEEDDEPRQLPQRPTLRFADQPPPQGRQQPRQSAFRRGKNASR